MNNIFLVDIDGTTVDSPWYWWEYLKKNSTTPYKYDSEMEYVNSTGKLLPYNYTKCFDNVNNAFDFWFLPDLYDTMRPIDGAIDALQHINAKYGTKIVFCSHVCGGHYDSKIRFLNKYFPFRAGEIVTGQKNFAIPSLFAIDDRNSYLNMIDSKNRLRMVSYVEQDEELQVPATDVMNWNNVLDFVEKYFADSV